MRSLRTIIMLLLTLTLAPMAKAQDVDVRAELASETVYAGEQLVLAIVVDGKPADDDPDVSSVTEFELQSLGPPSTSSQTFTNIINGKMRTVKHETFRYQYAFFAPSEPGTYTVPPIEVSVAGENYRTTPVRFRVIEPKQSTDFILTLDVDNDRPYLGEPVQATLNWYLGGQAQGPVRFALQPEESGFELLEIVEPVVTQADVNQRQVVEVEFAGRKTYARLAQERFEGRVLTAVTVEAILLPRQAGATTLGGASVSFEVPTSQPRNRGMFDSIFDQVRTERYLSRARPIPVTVRPLPLEGRPDDFSGLVGSVGIECFADPRQANVGDPITFMIRLTGTPPLRRIEAPDVTQDPRFTKAFRISEEEPSISVGRDAKTIVRTIRANSAMVKEIPSLELSYFDTKAGEYRTARSQPVPLEISATREVTAADAEGVPGDNGLSALEDRQRGIAANVDSGLALRDMPSGLGQRLRQPTWLLVMFLPLTAYLAAGAVVLVRREQAKDPEGRRKRRALKQALRTLKRASRATEAQQPTLVSRAVRRYIADRLLLPEDSLTTAECVRGLEAVGVDPSAARDLLTELDRSKFTPTPTSMPVSKRGVGESAAELITQLDRDLKGVDA